MLYTLYLKTLILFMIDLLLKVRLLNLTFIPKNEHMAFWQSLPRAKNLKATI